MSAVDYSETQEPVQPQEVDVVMARTICGEARGESYQDKIAMGWVIMNRVALPGPRRLWVGEHHPRRLFEALAGLLLERQRSEPEGDRERGSEQSQLQPV